MLSKRNLETLRELSEKDPILREIYEEYKEVIVDGVEKNIDNWISELIEKGLDNIEYPMQLKEFVSSYHLAVENGWIKRNKEFEKLVEPLIEDIKKLSDVI